MTAQSNRYRISVLHALAITAFLCGPGCQRETTTQTAAPPDKVAAASRSGIAVIDLNRLADGIGATEKIRDAIRATEQELVQDLVADRKAWFDEASAESMSEFTTVAQSKFDELPEDDQKSLAQETQAAQALLLRRQLELREEFQKQISGVAFEIAREHGFDTVLTTGQVFATTAEHDITAAVIARIQARNQAAVRDGESSTQSPPTTAKLPGGGSFPLR